MWLVEFGGSHPTAKSAVEWGTEVCGSYTGLRILPGPPALHHSGEGSVSDVLLQQQSVIRCRFFQFLTQLLQLFQLFHELSAGISLRFQVSKQILKDRVRIVCNFDALFLAFAVNPFTN